ncbi:MAG: tyrosine--tRNA ligase [bacterium]
MKKNEDLFSRGVANFVDPDNTFQRKVEAKINGEYKQDIVIKWGADPTRPDIHLGHAVILRKLRAFQDAGCKVIFLIGDYTTQIGDPTGKSKVRPEISQAEIEANMKTYLEQVGKILNTDPSVFSWIRNSDWFTSITDLTADVGTTVTIKDQENKNHITVDANSFVAKATLFEGTRMQKNILQKKGIHTVSFSRVLSTLRHITHSRLIERDMFKDRIAKGEELYMHEMMYPVLQGIDSSLLANIYGTCDLEIGGTDQLFNMLMGRDVMKMNNQEQQSVMAIDLLEGLDGKEKMSKSLDNYIGVTDEPNDMYGKVMSVPDALIPRYFALASYTPLSEVEEIKNSLASTNVNPRDLKMRLAKEIVAIYHGEKAAADAEQNFVDTFSKGKIPENVSEVAFSLDENVVDVLIKSGCAVSKTEARRLVENGAVTFLDTDTKITDMTKILEKGTYRVGKIRFFKVV